MPESAMYDVYQEYYQRVKTSACFSKYCKYVFGIDLSQDGFCTKRDIDFMIKALRISRTDICLDIGCGNGKIANYISGKTQSKIDGFDYSPNAISDANQQENRNASFFVKDINAMESAKSKYSIIYLIDSMYFSADYSDTLSILCDSLLKNGKIGAFYSEMTFEKEKQTRKIPGHETKFAQSVDTGKYQMEIHDFTGKHYALMRKKRIGSIRYREGFLREGNEFLFNRAFAESNDSSMTFEQFEKFSPRYFYILTKK